MDPEGFLALIRQWYDGERPVPDRDPERYVVCAGLAVLERLRDRFPLREEDFLTEKNQVRTSKAVIQKILHRFGETRVFLQEGGRTTRGTRTAAEKLVQRLNAHENLSPLNQDGRTELADKGQEWLVQRVREYFSRQRLDVDINLENTAPQIVTDILFAAEARGITGAVAQHLVGAKLAVRYPDIAVDNHSYTTADKQLGRPGDFIINDTVFHVTVAPMPAVISRCVDNLRNGYRVNLMVTEGKSQAAQQMAETFNIDGRVGIWSIEAFVGQNMEEMSAFRKHELAEHLRTLLETYNQRIHAAETDHSLLMNIPENLSPSV